MMVGFGVYRQTSFEPIIVNKDRKMLAPLGVSIVLIDDEVQKGR